MGVEGGPPPKRILVFKYPRLRAHKLLLFKLQIYQNNIFEKRLKNLFKNKCLYRVNIVLKTDICSQYKFLKWVNEKGKGVHQKKIGNLV